MLLYKDECIEVAFTTDSIHLKGLNFNVEIRERVVIVKGSGEASVHGIRGGKKKVVYIQLENNRGVKCTENAQDELSSTLAQIKRIVTSVGDFISIVPSGRFLIDYAIVGENIVALLVPGRKNVYIDREGKDSVTVYFV
ncbi:MAG: hypothetical protein QW733_01645 [Desulfurococcaceae archaeon]